MPLSAALDVAASVRVLAAALDSRIAIKMLDDAGIPYEKVLAEDTPELAAKLGIHQAPTLVSGGQLYTGAGAIKKFIAEQK